MLLNLNSTSELEQLKLQNASIGEILSIKKELFLHESLNTKKSLKSIINAKKGNEQSQESFKKQK